ncbi:hypothetical protein B0H13DRAFT_1966662 [Mycena leptocephala]|nr:hypothetical protein B0H13DRAFT_1966662 [Mycena leptocephala]
MQSLAKPTFVLVLGLAHGPVHFQSLVESLHAKGYPTESISHPTVGPLAVTAPPNADAENLRRVLEELINEDVVLFCHSYGGFVGSQVKGFEQSARAKAGQKGGIVKVICLSANLPREGESMMQILTELAIVPRQWMQLDPANGTFVANSQAAETLYHDLPDDQAEYWSSKLEPVSPRVAIAAASNVCWDTDVSKRLLERVRGDKQRDWETYEMDCGHSPFLSHVDELTEILTKA